MIIFIHSKRVISVSFPIFSLITRVRSLKAGKSHSMLATARRSSVANENYAPEYSVEMHRWKRIEQNRTQVSKFQLRFNEIDLWAA